MSSGRKAKVDRQAGMALIFSLLLLFVLTVVGVASFSNAHIQERSAGNSRLQSMAIEAAAAGASNAINFFDSHRDLGPDQLCGASGHEGWDAPTDWVDMGQIGDAQISQRLYCLADSYPCSEDAVDCDVRPPRSQLFVLSRGEVMAGGISVASRDIEVRLEVGSIGAAGDGCGALCFPACGTGTMNFPNSNAFQVDGGGGPAITAGCASAQTAIRSAIRNNRIGNYIGGVHESEAGAPWNDPDSVEAFRQNVMAAAQAYQNAGLCQANCYNPGDVRNNGNDTYGTVDDPQITYIEGDASMGGNISGAGILLVNGNLSWNGTPSFQGLMVSLGGTFGIAGGGRGGNHAGSVVILNAPGGVPASDFGNASFTNNGGGTADYNFDCDALWAAQSLLDADGQALWSPECDTGPAHPYQAGPTELVVASWRENIGWRESYFNETPEVEEE